MSEPLQIIIPGEPHAQARARTRVVTAKDGRSFAHVYDPPASRNWKATAQEHMRRALEGRRPLAGPVHLEIVAYFSCPRSHWRKRTPRPMRWHTKKPDRDNVEKAIKDAAKGVLWFDDCQVCAGETLKFIAAQGEPPRIKITVAEILEAPAAYLRRREIARQYLMVLDSDEQCPNALSSNA